MALCTAIASSAAFARSSFGPNNYPNKIDRRGRRKEGKKEEDRKNESALLGFPPPPMDRTDIRASMRDCTPTVITP